jgi:hypothetical protein
MELMLSSARPLLKKELIEVGSIAIVQIATNGIDA